MQHSRSKASSNDFRSLGSEVDSNNAGLRLDAYLAKNFPFLGRQKWRQRCDQGEVIVSGNPRKRSYRIQGGEAISYYYPESKEPEIDRNVSIIYQDEDVLIANKPPNLPMHEGSFYRLNTFAEIIKNVAGPNWAATHRIDQATSGIVVCGSNYETRSHLSNQFLNRSISKEYLFLTSHVPENSNWIMDQPITKSRVSNEWTRYWIDSSGPEAVTAFSVESHKNGLYLIRAFPKTGRTLQIRIHAAASGVPLLGDDLCQPGVSSFIEYKSNGPSEKLTQLLGHSRACLHAAAITFEHPTSRKILRISCPLFSDMNQIWNQV